MGGMEKKSRKLLITVCILIFAVITVIAISGIILLYKRVGREIKADTRSDYYLEQMLRAAASGDKSAMESLYQPQNVFTKQTGQEIQGLLDIWEVNQGYTYNRTGYNRKLSIFNNRETTRITSTYTVTLDNGKKMNVTLQRVEQDDGNSGLAYFNIKDAEVMKPVGTLGSISQWNHFQWGMFILSLTVIASTVVTAVICYRQSPKYRWGWIALILLAYFTVGFTALKEEYRSSVNFTYSITIAGLSKYVIYPGSGARLLVNMPMGMIVYWIMKRKLSEQKHLPPSGKNGTVKMDGWHADSPENHCPPADFNPYANPNLPENPDTHANPNAPSTPDTRANPNASSTPEPRPAVPHDNWRSPFDRP